MADKKSSKKSKSKVSNSTPKAKSERFFNRELSWLEFNDRILHEARDVKNPLLERVKFLSITASNLDEFYIVRVASLRDMVSVDIDTVSYKASPVAVSVPVEFKVNF